MLSQLRVFLSKRGQAELIGLVIIVIMITLGILFMAKFALQDSPEKKIFTRKGLAYSTMSSLLRSEIACEQPGDARVLILEVGKELIEDCAKDSRTGRGEYSCSGMNSCEFIEVHAFTVLNSTLGVWQKDYLFESRLLQGDSSIELISVRGGEGCIRSTNRDSSGLFPLFVTNVGLVENILYLCD